MKEFLEDREDNGIYILYRTNTHVTFLEWNLDTDLLEVVCMELNITK